MPKSFFARRKILKSLNTLELIPITLVSHENTDENKIKLLIPRFSQKWLQNIFTGKKKSTEFRISLDEIGSSIWLLIDSTKTVETIVNQLHSEMQYKNLSVEGLEQRVSIFISRLYQEEYITFKQLL